MSESDSIPAGTPIGGPAGDLPTAAGPPAFKDRRIGLIVFGIVQLLMALGCLGIAGMQMFLLFRAEALAPEVMGSPGVFAFSVVFYALLAAGAAWLGIGSIRCRRWARAVTLVLAWMGLVLGFLSSVLLAAVFRKLAAEMTRQAAGAEAGVTFALGCTFLAMASLYVIIPAAFVLFYRSPHVEATCEHHDPKRRWTDGIPLPVVAGGILLLSTATAVFVPLMGAALPFFGEILTGALVWVYAIAVAGLALFLLPGFLRLERRAWLGALSLITFNSVNAALTFRGDGLARMYDAMDMPPEQLEAMESIGFMTIMPGVVLVTTLMMLGFYLWLGRYFPGSKTA